MTTLKTVLHGYRFDVSKPEERKAWQAFKRARKAEGCKLMGPVWDTRDGKKPDPGPVELETSCLFDNQWNTPTHRVFDWLLHCYPNKAIKAGHYLEQTGEMREIRRNTLKCGYCEHMEPAAKGYIFCPACLDSPYLTKERLYLTRLVPVDRGHCDIPPLTPTELDRLLPLYVHAQTVAKGSRAAAKAKRERDRVIADKAKAIETANAEHDGKIWLLDRNFPLENVIYYPHTGRYCFGWREPVSDEVASEILDFISEFPFPYEIKTTSRTYEGY